MKTIVPAAAALAVTAIATGALAQARPAAARPAAAAPAAAAAPQGPPASGPPITGVCLISQERAVAESTAGRAAGERMRQLQAQVEAELKPESDALEADARTFQQQQAALTAEQRQTRGQALQARIAAFQQKAGVRQRELQATQQKALGRIAEQLNPVLRTLYTGRNCAILLNSEAAVLVANPAMDLTDASIQQLNSRFPTITFDRERAPAAPAGAPAAAPAR